jgi:hypothetical protein
MKNDLSFKVLAATVLAGLFLSLVDASTARENPAAAAEVAVLSAPAVAGAHVATPAATSGALALSEP